jgi:hypothetical protein
VPDHFSLSFCWGLKTSYIVFGYSISNWNLTLNANHTITLQQYFRSSFKKYIW